MNPNDHRPNQQTPRQRIGHPHWRDAPARRIEIVTRQRLDLSFTTGKTPRIVTISLPRVAGFFEEDGKQ